MSQSFHRTQHINLFPQILIKSIKITAVQNVETMRKCAGSVENQLIPLSLVKRIKLFVEDLKAE